MLFNSIGDYYSTHETVLSGVGRKPDITPAAAGKKVNSMVFSFPEPTPIGKRTTFASETPEADILD